jgi:cell pole-organizing protein PopZ
MTQPAKSQEPSMEEILASIRRIIADDDASKAPAKPAEAVKPAPRGSASSSRAAAAPEPDPMSSAMEAESGGLADSGLQDPDILDLTESMANPAVAESAPEPEPSSSAAVKGFPHSEHAEPEPAVFDEPEAEQPGFASAPAPSPEPHGNDEQARVGVPGVSERGQLLSNATAAAVDSAFNALAQTVLMNNARTLEDLVREMLRPMLKTWLDDNLPRLVERLVRAEIERVARGR